MGPYSPPPKKSYYSTAHVTLTMPVNGENGLGSRGEQPSVKCGICHNVFAEHWNIETVHKTV